MARYRQYLFTYLKQMQLIDISYVVVQKDKHGTQVDVPPPTVPTHRRATVSFKRSTASKLLPPPRKLTECLIQKFDS